MHAFYIFIFQPFGFITYPGKNSFGKAVIFRQLDDAVPDGSSKGSEVAGIGVQGYIGKAVDDLIKNFFDHLVRRDITFLSYHELIIPPQKFTVKRLKNL